MGMEDINPNRGLVQRPLPNGGPLISMCKKVPGIYFDANGEPCSDELAASAGFDVKADKKLKAKNEAHEIARAKIEAKFAEDTAALDSGADPEPDETDETDETEGEGSETDEGATFIERTHAGKPRVARTVQGGPVKKMEYIQGEQAWSVFNRDTKAIIASGMDEEAATDLLLAE